MSKLSALGLPPAASSSIAFKADAQIEVFALRQPGAIVGGPRIGKRLPLIDGVRIDKSRFLVATVDKDQKPSFHFGNSLSTLFSSKAQTTASIVLDLRAIGALISTRAARPLLRFLEAA